MHSKNHLFPGLENQIVQMYKRTVPSTVAGLRLDPFKPNEFVVIEFVLVGNPANFNHNEGTFKFDPHNDVIALYSQREVTFFEMQNKALLKNGLLAVYKGSLTDESETQINDAELARLLKAPKPSFVSKIKEFSVGDLYRLRSLTDERTEAWRLQLLTDELHRRVSPTEHEGAGL